MRIGFDGDSALTAMRWSARSYATHWVRCSSAALDPPYPGSTPPLRSAYGPSPGSREATEVMLMIAPPPAPIMSGHTLCISS
ncbi:hypothetical protein PICSAR198_02229 [Mycobacterium avium subsp. paratuberculosis]|nr:hypothetical protein PICSAR198_02229 [Mycobacterium avium subsp. paratuberculosis]